MSTTTGFDRIEHVQLVDGTGAAPIADATLCVTDGRITYAGAAAGAPQTTPADRVLDASGHTLTPGFIDCHVHLGFESAAGLATRFLDDPTLAVYQAGARMQQTLTAGVTTVRDLCGLPAGHRFAQEQGLLVAPRLRTAVRVLSHTGGHGDLSAPCGFDPTVGMAEIVDTPHEVRTAVRRVLRDGADVIKVAATGGMGSPHDQPDDEGLSVEEMRTVVDEVARHGGRPVAAHAQGLGGILNALRAGVTSIEHAYGIDDEGIDLVGENGAWVVPTLSTVFDGVDKSTMKPYHYEKKIRWSERTRTNIGHAIEQGVRIAMGTDAAVCPHGQNLRELGHMVSLGMSPLAAIRAGTGMASQLLGIDDEVGTLTEGMLADVVLCKGDPIHDIALLGRPENVVLVLQGGVIRKNRLVVGNGYLT